MADWKEDKSELFGEMHRLVGYHTSCAFIKVRDADGGRNPSDLDTAV
jgi:hypothetical protein